MSARKGILAGGNWIVDKLKFIDTYPQQDALTNILTETTGNGGSPSSLCHHFATLDTAARLTPIFRAQSCIVPKPAVRARSRANAKPPASSLMFDAFKKAPAIATIVRDSRFADSSSIRFCMKTEMIRAFLRGISAISAIRSAS
jgi:hypothetical protein